MDEVECAECGLRYDSEDVPFCPKCGAGQAASVDAAALARPSRTNPRRRRVQMAGIILGVFGLFMLYIGAVGTIAPPEPDDAMLDSLAENEFFAEGDGGTLRVHVAADGAPAAAVINITSMKGEPLHNATTFNGSYEVRLKHAMVIVNVAPNGTDGNATMIRAYVADGERLTWRVDLALGEDDAWINTPLDAIRIISACIGAFGMFVTTGGVLAFKLRGRRVALAAGWATLVPSLLVAVVAPLLLVHSAAVGMALWFLHKGRDQFK